ncbi:hypothetical protein PF005_g3495 [Phytophthora fragariae]|uniref:Secreted protein n=1 Tax=Phytophthora fragariae TaxID=53985 RepID=A0A6A3M1L4_9STRA|nr:hypothetical protein PF003_g11066 [Phytophthora fragariae]KAE9025719.1 hypothetical protein PF011_g2910 [Phytophthora fragariae]KAE9230396.1 hypothetical protein PF005_g3495 [Phytophthora fragariae]KAE9325063.1 hypothetical protein PF001_g3129 [Phytophthora fragariae]
MSWILTRTRWYSAFASGCSVLWDSSIAVCWVSTCSSCRKVVLSGTTRGAPYGSLDGRLGQ